MSRASFFGQVAVAFAALLGCGGAPEAVPSVPPAPEAALTWASYSDVERITELKLTPDAVWARSQDGVLKWDKATGSFSREAGPGAPGGEATAVLALGARVLVGLPQGLAVRDGGQYEIRREPPFADGVIGLASHPEGALVVTPKLLARLGADGLVGWSTRYQVKVVAEQGPIAWLGTDGHGVVRVQGRELTEYTVGQGLCGNRIATLTVARTDVVATCQDGPGRLSVSADLGQHWETFEIRGLSEPVKNAWPLPGGALLLQGATRFYRADRGAAAGPALVPYTGPQVVAEPLAPPAELEPRPAWLPVAQPAGALPAVPELGWAPVKVARGAATPKVGAGNFSLQPLDLGLEGPVSAAAVDVDGTLYLALPYRGVLAIRDGARRRYTSLSLVPPFDGARLSVVGAQVLLTREEGSVLRHEAGAWRRWVVDPTPRARVLGVGAERGRTLAVVYRPPVDPKEKGTLHLFVAEGERFEARATLPLPPLDGEPAAGALFIDGRGDAYFPLFWTTPEGQRRGAGLAHLSAAGDKLEIWEGRFGLDEEFEGPPAIPDEWVNAVAFGPVGQVYVATNAGLARVAGKQVRVFDENDFIDSEVILDLAVDAKGRVFAGTLEGLGCLEGERFVPVPLPDARGRVSAVVVSPTGEIWAGTDTALYRGDGQRFTAYPASHGAILDLAFDGQGRLWLLTAQGVFVTAAP